MGEAIGMIVPLGAFAMVVLIVWMVHQKGQHKIREQAELQKHFLNKFGSGQELTQFLETPHGERFLKEMTIRDNAPGPKARIMGSIKGGIVLLALGAGFVVIYRFNQGPLRDPDLIFPTVILLALGIGLLFSAGVSYWLSKKWDIFEERDIPLQKRIDLK
jgi:hypothetical protein